MVMQKLCQFTCTWWPCISVHCFSDLLGMGNSGQLQTGGYGFETQYRYLGAWMRSIGLSNKLIFVGYEWGAGLAARWLYENPDKSKGFIYIEGILSPIRSLNDINSKTFQKLVEFAKSTEVIPDSQDCIKVIREKLNYYVSEISLTNIQFSESGPLANPADSAAAIIAGLREMPLEDRYIRFCISTTCVSQKKI